MSTEFNEAIKEIKDLLEAKDKMSQQLWAEKTAELAKRMDEIETKANRPVIARAAEDIARDMAKEHKEDLTKFMQTGEGVGDMEMARKTGVIGSDAATSGGVYTLYSEYVQGINGALAAISPIRRIATVRQVSGRQLDNVVSDRAMVAGWTTETASRTVTTASVLSTKNITIFEAYAMPEVSQTLLEDSVFDLEAWLSGELIDAFAKLEGTAYVSGNGSTAPAGIILSTNGVTRRTLAASGTMSYADLRGLIGALPDMYDANASFVMNKSFFFSNILGLEDTDGHLVWQGSLNAMGGGVGLSLLGYPVVFAADMPTAFSGTNNLIALGDFKKGYMIADHPVMTMVRDAYSNKPYVQFYSRKRTGGIVVVPDAIRILSVAAA